MTTNPFTTNAIRDLNLLIGRDDLLLKLKKQIASGPVLLCGGRRTGKSSLLRCLAAIKPNDISKNKWWYWDAQMLQPGCGLDGASLKYGGKEGLESEIEKAANNGERLVLLIDEFDCLGVADHDGGATRFEMSDYENLRGLLGEYDRNFSMIAVSSTNLPDINMRGSELFNMFLPIYMNSLALKKPIDFYEQYLKMSGELNIWQEKQYLFEEAIKYAASHPWLLQLSGQIVCSVDDINDYHKQLITLTDNVSKHVGKILNTLEERSPSEAVWFCLCCIGVPGDSALNHLKYESLGLITNGIVPGAIKLAIHDWLGKRPQSSNTDDSYWENVVQKLVGKSVADVIQHGDFVEAVRCGYLEVSTDGYVNKPNKPCFGSVTISLT